VLEKFVIIFDGDEREEAERKRATGFNNFDAAK
jgi:hypothetical protein